MSSSTEKSAPADFTPATASPPVSKLAIAALAAGVLPLAPVAVGLGISGLVVTRADKRRGRGGALVPSPVKATALELGLPVTDRVDDVIDADAELGVVVAFGRLIKPHVLDALPMVNMHFSLSNDLTPLAEFLRLWRERGPQGLASVLERGTV